MTVRTDTELVEVGMSIWPVDFDVTDLEASQVKGGTVVAIETDVDRDTGEVQRRFVCASPWRRTIRFDVITADQVKTVEPMNVAAVRTLIRSAARVVAESKRIFTTDEARCVRLQSELMEVLG